MHCWLGSEIRLQYCRSSFTNFISFIRRSVGALSPADTRAASAGNPVSAAGVARLIHRITVRRFYFFYWAPQWDGLVPNSRNGERNLDACHCCESVATVCSKHRRYFVNVSLRQVPECCKSLQRIVGGYSRRILTYAIHFLRVDRLCFACWPLQCIHFNAMHKDDAV